MACAIIQHTEPKIFDRFFTVLRRVLKRKRALPLLRRIVIRVPTYDTHIISSCRHAMKKNPTHPQEPPRLVYHRLDDHQRTAPPDYPGR